MSSYIAKLGITSSTLSPAEITNELGQAATFSKAIGDPKPGGHSMHERTIWIIRFGEEDQKTVTLLQERFLQFIRSKKDKLRQLADMPETSIYLTIVAQYSDTQMGLVLTADDVSLLGEARVGLDFNLECADES